MASDKTETKKNKLCFTRNNMGPYGTKKNKKTGKKKKLLINLKQLF